MFVLNCCKLGTGFQSKLNAIKFVRIGINTGVVQCKILNRILNCNYNLYTLGIKDSALCIKCGYVDVIQHHA